MAMDIGKLIYKKIKKYDCIVVARHIGPDPDAIASQIALRDAIRFTFPQKKVLAVGASVTKFKYFGTLDKENYENIENALLIILDVPTLDRVDGIEGLSYKEVIKLDHHPCEEKVADLEMVEEEASSACQIVADFIFKTPMKMNASIASNLFLGIVSDSDRFLLSYTTAKTFQIVSKLIDDYNLDFAPLYNNLYERPINEIRFHGYLAEHLNLTENGLAYVKITPEILKEYGVDNGTPSNMINDFNYIKEVLAWIFITYDESHEVFKVNIRSRGPVINETAEKYNGGGHKFASGARCKTEEEINSLLKDLDKVCKSYKESLE